MTSKGPLSPTLKAGQPVDWWFVFKFNAGTFEGCSDTAERACPFGGAVQDYSHFSQQFAFASSADHTLKKGGGCLGDSSADPVGSTFQQVYNGHYFYVVWNDQFYGDPMITKASPWGHSKGMLAWDQNGEGMVMQVSTPSWPASGSAAAARKTDGNTLGCVKDNDVLVSQHFFSLKLTKDDVVAVLKGLGNASVVTDPTNPEAVKRGGPADITALVDGLGKLSTSQDVTRTPLSSGFQLISKPSRLSVPPWQMVSALLGSEPLRVASWWTRPEIPSTDESSSIACWNSTLGKSGPVEIATSGTWEGNSIGLQGMAEPDGNHAKVGVSTGAHKYVIFGDLNQQGTLSGPKCDSSQNGRGGLFYVLEDAPLNGAVSGLLKGGNDKTDQ